MGRDDVLRFGDFELDPGRLELRRNGTPVELQPMPLRLLLYLAEHRDRTVPQRELLATLWEGATVTDTALANALNQARQAVGDDGRAQRVIRTLKGHGSYRFVAEVTGTAGKAEQLPRQVVEAQANRSSWPRLSLAAIALLVLAVGLTWWVYRPISPELPLTSLAVLPFDDMSPDGGQRWLAEGVSEDVRESLSRVKELRVIARLSSELAVARGNDISAIGKQLEVGAIVEGSLRRSGDQLRITVELIRAADEIRLWSARYDRALTDGGLTIQQDVAREIAEAIRSELGVSEQVAWLDRARYATEDPRAYELLKKSTEIGKLSMTEEGLRASRAYAQRAVDIAPKYATAQSELAFAHYLLWLLGYERTDATLLAARAAANRALELDETDPAAHELLAQESLREWNFEAAEGRLQMAIELSPSFSGLRALYADVLAQNGRIEAALAQARRSIAIDPLFAGRHAELGRILSFAGQYEAAIASFERALEVDPNSPFGGLELAQAYHTASKDREALIALLRDPLVQADPKLEPTFRRAFADGGWAALNRAAVAALEAQAGASCGAPPAVGAHLYAAAGDADRMYACLDRAVVQMGNWALWLPVHPSWDPYRAEPRFQGLLRRVGLVH